MKKINFSLYTLLLMTLSIFASANTYDSFDALYSAPVKTNHIVRKFDKTQTSYAPMQYIWINAAGAVTTIPGVRIQNPTNTEGYWIKQRTTSDYTVRDYGASCESVFKTFATLGVSQGRIDNIYGALLGNGTITTTDGWDYAAVRVAMKLAESSIAYSICKFTPEVYWITRDLNLPVLYSIPGFSGGIARRFEINLNGAYLCISNTNPVTVFRRVPADQTVALSTYIFACFYIHDGSILGKNGTGQYGIQLGATLGSVIERVTIADTDYGVYLRFCLSTRVGECTTSGIMTIAMAADWGNWTGASTSNSQSNATNFYQNRILCANGSTAAFFANAASNIVYDGDIIEGGSPVYGIHHNNNGNAAVKDGFIRNLYCETLCTGALVRVRYGTNGTFEIDGIANYVLNQTLVEFESGATPQMTIMNCWILETGNKFANIGANNCWRFINNDLGGAPWRSTPTYPQDLRDPRHPYATTAWKTGGSYSIPKAKYNTSHTLQSDYRVWVTDPIIYNETND